MAAAVIAVLLIGTFFGLPVTEVQCCIMMFLSSCGTHSNYLAMNVARHFLSPLQSVSSIGALAFNIGAMGVVWLLWALLLWLWTSFFQREGFHKAAKSLAFPGAPLLLTRVLLPGVWFNAFANIDDNKAALWVGVVVGGIVFFGNAIMIFKMTDMYYESRLDDVLYNFFFPDHTSDIARSYFYVAGAGARNAVMMYWVVMPIFVAALVSSSATKDGDSCGLPMGFLVAILWLVAILFAILRPHGTPIRSFIYAALEFVVGAIALVILVKDSTAQSVFTCFLLIVVVILMIQTVSLWLYTFCYRKGASKGHSKPPSTEKEKFSDIGTDKGPQQARPPQQGPASIRRLEDELEAERAQERRAMIAQNREYDKMNIADSKRRGSTGGPSEGGGSSRISDAELAARYNAMLSATAKGLEDPEAKRRKEIQQQFAARNDTTNSNNPPSQAANTEPSGAPPNPTMQPATAPLPSGAAVDGNASLFSSVGSPNPPSAAPANTTAAEPYSAYTLPGDDDDEENLDPREKRRRRMEREAEAYPY